MSAPERLEFTSLGDTPRTFPTALGNSTYSLQLANTSFISSDLTPEQLLNPTGDSAELYGYVLHVELLWIPLAGKTAVDPEATNISIRLIVFSGHEVGLYGGGGFAWPKGEPGDKEYGVDIVGSNATLLAATNGFKDLLSPAQLTGRLRSKLDEAQNKQIRRAASQIVTNALKRVQWVGPRASELQKQASTNGDEMDNADFVLR
ncbi:MAG: hypothetical protein O2875_02235 [Planctomycetota bacterium]|nr:hypothetical protein [Planctomycetota bacterium]MDA1262054.1 hypothetical protein [Planctomycetota bacterium]